MPKITVKEQSAPQPAASQEEKTVLTDSKGRHITLRELDPLEESRIFIAVGAANAANHTYMSGYAFPAAMVESIDDIDYQIPVNQAQIDGRLKHLGREGMLAIREYMIDAMKNAGLGASEDDVEQAAKN
ncbi:hypothetical protein [Enterobacter roggenkampii]|jgi:hypothetical protein|uniref:Uncharacterized protein n=1 Tax=Enterobacter roggenkampii TaxID=1812935 RepID=A0A837LC76_9ENTR|nr:hypothetical protein [Enterobacter roggenkampii]KLQ00669.1 hypothetical protein ABF77_16135 [Enterobacter roggenkampii]DAL36415.1 MAG TPA_asm: hypothetical protein [Caudoviricetes sp.]